MNSGSQQTQGQNTKRILSDYRPKWSPSGESVWSAAHLKIHGSVQTVSGRKPKTHIVHKFMSEFLAQFESLFWAIVFNIVCEEPNQAVLKASGGFKFDNVIEK